MQEGEGRGPESGSALEGEEGKEGRARNDSTCLVSDLLSFKLLQTLTFSIFWITNPIMEDDDPRHTTEAGDDEVLAALEEMEKVINELNIAGREFSISLHQKHVALATQAGLDDQVEAARTMMVQSVTCGDGKSLTRRRRRQEQGREGRSRADL